MRSITRLTIPTPAATIIDIAQYRYRNLRKEERGLASEGKSGISAALLEAAVPVSSSE
jgi:hypothetical protein